ncbi:MAG: hemerythrin domain-containing protein, partial [Pseudomonadota bacterium]
PIPLITPGAEALTVSNNCPLQELSRAHKRKLDLCDLLEDIADSLPEPDRVLCMQAAAILTIELPMHHADEDLGLFPLLRKRCLPGDRFDAIADRLGEEHVDLEASLAEIVAMLRSYSGGAQSDGVDQAAGYALRGLFEGLRRHIAWEEATVMPLARERLQDDDLAELKQAMAEHRVGQRPDALGRKSNKGTLFSEADA